MDARLFNSRRLRQRVVAVVIAGWMVGTVGLCGADDLRELAKKANALADEELSRYEFLLNGDPVPLDREEDSVFRWTHSGARPRYGSTCFWTHKGCAKAVVTLYAREGDNAEDLDVGLEFQSLSEQPLNVKRHQRSVWSPAEAGVSFERIPDVESPGRSAEDRLAEMRALARTFRADFSPGNNPGRFQDLKLQPEPLFRYASRNPAVIDGAVFGFVAQSDPELLLIIEARANGNERTWMFAGARSRHDHLRLFRNGQPVWERETLAPPWSRMRDPRGTYFNQRWDRLADE